MASIPSNGYNEVMSGTNNYTGSNSFDGDCPQTPNPPTAPNDLTNKQYVDTLVGPPSGVGLGQILTVSNNATTQNITNVNTYDTTSPASGGSTLFNGTYRCRALGGGGDRIVEMTGYGIGRPASSAADVFNIANLYPSQDIVLETTNNVAIGGLKGRVEVRTALEPYSIVDSLGSQGTNGQVLVSRGTGAPYGSFNPQNLEWQSIAAGGVTSVSGGTNVDITGTPSAPVVNLRNPLTAELNVGAQSLRDSAGAVGTSGQVLTAGTGGQTLWSAPASGGVTSISAGTNIDITGTPSVPIVGLDSPLSATLNVGSQTISSTTAAINLTPLAGQDVNVNISNAGALHTIQTSAGGTAQPIARFNNSSASAGAVTIRTNKTGRNVLVGEVLASVQFNGRNFSGVDTTFGKIECSATTASVGDTDGSLDFYSLINGVNQAVFRLNGADNENNSFRPLDLNGNALKTSSGNMTIDTTASSGTGTLAITSKGATTITSTASGINLTASAAGTIQNNTTGAFTVASNTLTLQANTTGTINIPTELHSGKISTLYTNQIYRPVYQPVLTTSPNILPVAELTQEGHQVILINSGGDGSNELVVVPLTFFVPTCMELLQIGGVDYYVAGGYNHIQGRAEIRFSTNINNFNTDITSGFFQYVALLNGQRINCLCYDPVLIPDRIAFGGFFSALAGVTEYRPSLTYPSNVSNILVLDITNYATIAPISMADPSPNFPFTGVYGVDGEVYCCGTRAYDNALYYPPATAPFYIFGGGFGQLLGGGTGLPAFNQINFIPNGSFFPPDIKWFEFGGANQPITMIVNDDAGQIAMGGAFSNIGSSAVDLLAYSDSGLLATTTWQAFGAPPSPTTLTTVSVGKATFGWRHTAFTSGTTFLLGDGGFNNNVYEADLNNHTAPLTILKSALPSTPRGFAIDLANPTTRYVVGFATGGGSDYCWDFLTPHFLDLNGSVYMANTFFEVLAVLNAPLFFKLGIQAEFSPLQFSIETPASSGNIVINSTTALPFINPLQPTLKYDRITLAAYNNFAMGTLVGYGTDDVRILITNSLGATFSNQ